MANFIPVNAKSDIPESKKGKMTPAQNAIMNAWCLSNKTGILDFGGKCIANASTPIEGKSIITFNSGYFVVCGRLVEVEQNSTVDITLPVVGEQEGYIVAGFYLGNSKEQEFKVFTKTQAPITQDLNENPLTGIYEFELYKYTATSTGVTLTRNESTYIPDIGGKIQEVVDTITNNISGTGVIGTGTPPLQGYDKSKGTIEARLTALGFKQATITNWNTTYISTIEAFTQGKVVAVAIGLSGKVLDDSIGSLVGTKTVVAKLSDIDLSAIPSDGLVVGVKEGRVIASGGGYTRTYVNTYTLKQNGNLELFVDSTLNTIVEKVMGGFYKAITPQKTVIVKF